MTGIKSFRERVGFSSQTALARALSMNPSNISEWEAGNGFPSYHMIKKMLEMGATVEELFGISYKTLATNTSKTNFTDAELGDFVKRGLKFLLGNENVLD
jgi:transcriptional regulator with XRE-family HTH domain